MATASARSIFQIDESNDSIRTQTIENDRSRSLMTLTQEIAQWLRELGPLNGSSALAVGLFFAAAALIVFPRTPLIIAAGATYGLSAAPIILLGGTAGGVLAFCFSRYVASGRFHRWLERHQRLREIARAVDLEGWKVVALLRLGVPVPNAATNYMLGLTRIGLPSYALATLIFSVPQVVLFCFLGATGRASLLDSSRVGSSIVSVVLALALTGLISWRVRSRLRKSLRSSD
jgi:uncharacterized membrane protein YdjX (TVP38/TMEM64 family)